LVYVARSSETAIELIENYLNWFTWFHKICDIFMQINWKAEKMFGFKLSEILGMIAVGVMFALMLVYGWTT
jgi:hypothetical protein